MKISQTAYQLKHVHFERNLYTIESEHLFTHIFKFYSPKTGFVYILRAEYHNEDIFAVKFYCKQHRKSDFKYSKITNKGDVKNILLTCAKSIPILLKNYPTASFGFIGSRSIDKTNDRVENHIENQRYRIYIKIVSALIGTKTFQHREYPNQSGYLIINRKTKTKLDDKERAIIRMITREYETLPDIG